jgi:hypothetical protein
MSTAMDSANWHDQANGHTIRITSDSFSALAEIVYLGKRREEITLEVVQRARSQLGLGVGPFVPIFVAVVKLTPLPSESHSEPTGALVGRVWLPQGLVRHYREYFYLLKEQTA